MGLKRNINQLPFFMKTRFLKTNKLLIVFAIIVNLSTTAFSQIAVPDSTSKPLSCDASFKDMLPLILLTAGTDMTNLVALGPVDHNNYNKEYFWDFGDGTLDTGEIVLHNYKNPGKYLIKLDVIQHIIGIAYSFDIKCSHKEFVTVGNVAPLFCDASFQPMILSTMDYPSSYSSVIGYNAINQSYKSYHWDFGDGTKDTGRSVRHHFANEGKYLVSLIVKDNNCEDTKTMWMTKKGIYYPFDSTKTRCDAQISQRITQNTVVFSDLQPVITVVDGHYETWNWDFGDGSTNNENSMTHTYAKAGKYIATLTKSSFYNPCLNSGSPITCYAQPILKCTKTYQIEVVIEEPASKCKAELTYTITDKTLNLKDNIFYQSIYGRPTDNVTEVRTWDFGDGFYGDGQEVTHTYFDNGKYKVKLIKHLLFDPCPFIHDTLPRCMAAAMIVCTDTTYMDIEIGSQKPICKANFETKIEGKKVTVEANSTGKYLKYSKLDFGDGTFAKINDSVFTISHSYSQIGKYDVCLYISTIDSILPYVRYLNMCNDLVCQTITISDSVSDPIVASIYPNPASDYMTISVKNNLKKMDLRLYDQTGKLKKEVFEILSDSKQIDTYGLDNGLYFYTLSNGENVVLKGKIAVSK